MIRQLVCFHTIILQTIPMKVSLHEKCPNTEFFLVRIWTHFMQCIVSGTFDWFLACFETLR